MSISISDQRVGELVDTVASDAPTPGGGAVAGVVAALGAALVGMAGRYDVKHAGEDGAEAPLFRRLVERSDDIQARSAVLADDDAAAYGRYLQAVRLQGDAEVRRTAIRVALDRAVDVPLELAGLAAEVAEAGEQLAVSGPARMRPDACGAALLASAVATTAAILVEDNLHKSVDDPRVVQAVTHARTARAAADRAVAAAGVALEGAVT